MELLCYNRNDMASVIFLIIAIISSAAMAIVLKIFRKQEGNRYGIILGNYLTCVILALIFLPKGEGMFRASSASWLCGIAGGILFVAGLVGMQSSVRKNGAILTSAFSRLGLIVPLLVSILFFKEPLRLIFLPGVLLVFAAFHTLWRVCGRKTGGRADNHRKHQGYGAVFTDTSVAAKVHCFDN